MSVKFVDKLRAPLNYLKKTSLKINKLMTGAQNIIKSFNIIFNENVIHLLSLSKLELSVVIQHQPLLKIIIIYRIYYNQ